MAKWIYEMPNGADLREAIDDGDCHMVVEQVLAGVQNIVNFASREKDSGRIDKNFYEDMYYDFKDFLLNVSDTATYMETEEGFNEIVEEYEDFNGYVDFGVLEEFYNLCDEYYIWIPISDLWAKEIPEKGWAVTTYDKDGNIKSVEVKPDELSCAKLCVAQLRMGYPAPTVWHDRIRVMGY